MSQSVVREMFMSQINVLLIEDNQHIARQLTEFLEGKGIIVDYAANGETGVRLALSGQADVIILDVNLPDINGFTVCQRIKQQAIRDIPILMLTARDAIDDKAEGFGAGADDYLTKPFDIRELSFRIDALMRRPTLHTSHTITIGELKIDRRAQTAKRAGQDLSLTLTAYNILLALAQAWPNPVSRSKLTEQLWGDNPPDSDSLKSHIYSLRQAVDKPFKTPLIKTLTNIGYKIDVGQ